MKLIKSIGLFCCVILLLTGCVSNTTPQEQGTQTYVGVYPDPNYIPNAEDINAVPYVYEGQGEYFAVKCSVRVMSGEEQAFKVQEKEARLQQMEQLDKEYPMRGYSGLIEKSKSEIAVLKAADAVYVTEIFGDYVGEKGDLNSERIQYEISYNGQVWLSASASGAIALWTSLSNTADGKYSEGILLPCKESCDITIRCDGVTDTFKLVKN